MTLRRNLILIALISSCCTHVYSNDIMTRCKLLFELHLRALPSKLSSAATYFQEDTPNNAPIRMPITGRSVGHYLSSLHLSYYDFRGKKILDVASGKSRFTKTINDTFSKYGTVAVSLDAYADRTSIKDNLFTTASAYSMPYPDNTFDLTISSWFLNNIMFSEKHWKAALDEMLRVTKAGGEIRFMTIFLDTNLSPLLNYLEKHPLVKEVESQPPLPHGYVKIILKK